MNSELNAILAFFVAFVIFGEGSKYISPFGLLNRWFKWNALVVTILAASVGLIVYVKV